MATGFVYRELGESGWITHLLTFESMAQALGYAHGIHETGKPPIAWRVDQALPVLEADGATLTAATR